MYNDANMNTMDLDNLIQLLPEKCREFLSGSGLDINSLMDLLSPKNLWDTVWQNVRAEFSAQFDPVRQIFLLCLLCAVFYALASDSTLKQTEPVVSFVSASVCLAAVITPICQIIDDVCAVLQQGCVYLGTFAPAYGAAAAAAGRPVTATIYTSMSALAVQILSAFCLRSLKPLLTCFICLAVAGCLCDELSLSGILSSCKKALMWLISGAVILFNGILSVQAFVSKPTETLALKTGKTVVSALIPVVGSAVSDAFTTIYGSMSAAQSAVGVYGIVSVILMFLPVFFQCLLFRLSIWLCIVVCGLLQLPPAQKCMQGCAAVLDVLLALTGAFLCLFIISCMLLTGG